jgi:spermidine/putrescine transport system substrate-binding protein
MQWIRLIRQGVLIPLDKGIAAESEKHSSRLSENAASIPDNRYSVPYAYTLTLLGFNKNKMRELGLPTDTWAIIFEPEASTENQGIVSPFWIVRAN